MRTTGAAGAGTVAATTTMASHMIKTKIIFALCALHVRSFVHSVFGLAFAFII